MRFLVGDSLRVLRTMPSHSVHCIVTSPPYWKLRDYNEPGQLGIESSPLEYVSNLVAVFREARRILRDDGTMWLVLGDTYSDEGKESGHRVGGTRLRIGIPAKSIYGIPWRVAFALQDDGWLLRQDLIWHKSNHKTERATDRCTRAHEYIFLFTKQARYWFDDIAIQEPSRNTDSTKSGTRNKRSVWTVATTKPYKNAHFAVFPPKLIEPMILAGTSERGCCPRCGAQWDRIVERTYRGGTCEQGEMGQQLHTGLHDLDAGPIKLLGFAPGCDCGYEPVKSIVLDPFGGSGTTALVCEQLGRDSILIDISAKCAEMARERIANDAPLFSQIEV